MLIKSSVFWGIVYPFSVAVCAVLWKGRMGAVNNHVNKRSYYFLRYFNSARNITVHLQSHLPVLPSLSTSLIVASTYGRTFLSGYVGVLSMPMFCVNENTDQFGGVNVIFTWSFVNCPNETFAVI